MSGLGGSSFGFVQGAGAAGAPPPGPPPFLGLFYTLRQHGLKVSHHEWFAFLEGLERGLSRESLLGLYHLGRTVLVKRTEDLDTFDVAFATYFRDLPALPPEITDALERWLEEGDVLAGSPPPFPDGVSPLSLEELLRRFEETLKKQEEQHDGGSRWIGTGGTSPFGRGGRHPSGIRIGGSGGFRQALQVAGRRSFRAYRGDRVLGVREIRVALRRLRELVREGAEDELDLPETIESTGRNAGDIDLRWRRPRRNDVRLLLALDVGGSMTPYARLCSRLFSAAKQETHWRRLEHLYFHNCVYGSLYEDASFREPQATTDVIKTHGADWKLVLVGDACMAMSELLSPGGSIDWSDYNREPGLIWLQRLAAHFRKAVWLNPMPPRAWDHPSVQTIRRVFPMFPLTLDGLADAVRALRGHGGA